MTQKTKAYHFLYLIYITSCLYTMGLTNTFANPTPVTTGGAYVPNYYNNQQTSSTTPTTCLEAIKQAITTQMSNMDLDFNALDINNTVTNQMTGIFRNVMTTDTLCSTNTTKANLNNKTFDTTISNHTFKFTIKINSAVTPGVKSEYYLLFDNGNYDEDYKNITEPTKFEQATDYNGWSDACSQWDKNPHDSVIKNNRDLHKILKGIRSVLGTTARTEYVLNKPHSSKPGEVYQIKGLLLIAPNAQQDQRVVWKTNDKTKAYATQNKIAEAFNQGSRTACNGIRIYVLEHQIDNSTQEHKFIIHPNPITISR